MSEYQMDGTMHPTGEAALWRELCKCHEEIERLRGLLQECLPHIDLTWHRRANNDELMRVMTERPDLLARVITELITHSPRPA